LKNVYPIYKVFNKVTQNVLNKYTVKKYLEEKLNKKDIMDNFIKDIQQQS